MLTSTNVRNFRKIPSVMELPHLVEVQRQSFDSFLQQDLPPLKRKNEGLQALLMEVSPPLIFYKKLKVSSPVRAGDVP